VLHDLIRGKKGRTAGSIEPPRNYSSAAGDEKRPLHLRRGNPRIRLPVGRVALQPLRIQEVLLAPGRALVGEQVAAGEHANYLIAESGIEAIKPRLVEANAVDVGDDVDADWLNSDLEDEPRPRQIFGRQVMQWCAESLQRCQNPLGIRPVGSNPHVEVLRCAHQTVSGQCMRADDEELNAMRVEFG
jgi:hypothetical protein